MKHFFVPVSVLFPFLFLWSFCVSGQTDVLILKKNGANRKTYAPGMYIRLQTVYDQWLDGALTDLRHDSIFLNGIPFHYKEIRAIRIESNKSNIAKSGALLMLAGGGVLLLGAVNGLYRKDAVQDWYKPSSYIVSGAFLLTGFLLLRTRTQTYRIGRKFSLEYFQWNPNKN